MLIMIPIVIEHVRKMVLMYLCFVAEGGSSKASALAIPQSKGSQGKSREHEGNKPSPNMRLHGMKTR